MTVIKITALNKSIKVLKCSHRLTNLKIDLINMNRRRKARERQQKLMNKFANKQKAFMQQNPQAASGMWQLHSIK